MKHLSKALGLCALSSVLVSQVQAQEHEHQDLSRFLAPAETSSVSESPDVRVGCIRVDVLDGSNGQPVANAEVEVGMMQRSGDRSRTQHRTGENGRVEICDLGANLPVGTSQAYRVNVPFEGAVYRSTPFNLSATMGTHVRVLRLPVVREIDTLLQVTVQIVMEMKDERFHVSHLIDLANLGEMTVVLPAEGLLARLPHGFTAFEAEASMEDHRVVADSEGARWMGSFPPGRTRIAYGYDLKIEGHDMEFAFGQPTKSYVLRMVAESVGELEMRALDFPPPERVPNGERMFWLTELHRRPEETQINEMRVSLTHIPGPPPFRYIAAALAAILVLGGAAFSLRKPKAQDVRSALVRNLEARKVELLAQAAQLKVDHQNEIVGPETFKNEMEVLQRELAKVLAEISMSSTSV